MRQNSIVCSHKAIYRYIGNDWYNRKNTEVHYYSGNSNKYLLCFIFCQILRCFLFFVFTWYNRLMLSYAYCYNWFGLTFHSSLVQTELLTFESIFFPNSRLICWLSVHVHTTVNSKRTILTGFILLASNNV